MRRLLRLVEVMGITLGILGALFTGAAYLHTLIGSNSAISAFKQAEAAEQQTNKHAITPFTPDQSLWSDKAKFRYQKEKRIDSDTPLALLTIERLNLEAPVFLGTDNITLNKGVGIIEGTAMPGEVGNVALSGHRDSFFRVLKDIELGDKIQLRTLQGAQQFKVTDISIVDPLDVSVLSPSSSSVLTLITCYPFYFVGYAPERYIVHAELVDKQGHNNSKIFKRDNKLALLTSRKYNRSTYGNSADH